MRYRDLVQESMFGSQQGPRQLIQTIMMSLAARGIHEVPTNMVSAELRKRSRMNVPTGQLVDLLASLPMVSSADRDSVTLRDENEEMQIGPGDAQDQVADMATNGVKADNSF